MEFNQIGIKFTSHWWELITDGMTCHFSMKVQNQEQRGGRRDRRCGIEGLETRTEIVSVGITEYLPDNKDL